MNVPRFRMSGIVAVVCLIAAAIPTFSFAQEGQIEEVIVTGSRIARPNLTQPTPVTTLSSEDLRMSGSTDLGDLLAELPALGSTGTLSGNSNSFGDAAGLNLPDLRRLGISRTLTLVNGKRHVGGDPGSTAVDLGSIPIALVERVEVITGGASAVYGSDAVSGVINIILRDDFEGVEVDLQTGQSWDGDYAKNYQASLTVGRNFGEDRGNFTFSLMRDRIGDVQAGDLDQAKAYGTIINPASQGESDGIPDRILVQNLFSELIDENGVLFPFSGGPPTSFGNAAGIIAFDVNGNPMPQTPRAASNSFAFGSFPNGCDTCFKLEDWITVVPEVERTAFQGTTRYRLTDWSNFYMDAKYVTSDIQEELQPSFDFGGISINVAENPFLDEALRAELLGLGVTTATMARFHGDAGSRHNDIERETKRVVAGFEGLFDTAIGGISYDLFYNYGETNNTVNGLNRQVPSNFQAALDAVVDPATGEIVCRSSIDPTVPQPPFSGCVPFNPFGQQNTPEALAYSFVETTEEQSLIQKNAGLTFVSDTAAFLTLPAGPIGWAAGVEWRREQTSTNGDTLVQADLTAVAAQPDQVGGYEVFEGFVEVSVPLLTDRFLAQALSVDAAYRTADYTHAGSVDAWKVGAIWAPFDQVRFRATISEAVRAPNITEAFLPATPGFASVFDPCDVDRIANDPDRAANCAALGIPPNFQANDNVSVESESSGNEDLIPEDSESYTVGVVYQPPWAEGLAVTLDYYDIEITDAIVNVAPQAIVDNCVDASGGPDGSFCSLFTRDATGNIDFVRSTFVNASALETEGIDLELSYNKQLSDWTTDTPVAWLGGNLAVSVVGNYLKQLNVFTFQDRPDEIDIERGEVGDPIRAFRATVSYQTGNVTLGWQGRYIGSVKRYERQISVCEDTLPCKAEATMYHDVTARYFVPMDEMTVELYGGVNNVLDTPPPRGIVGVETNEAIYDAIGRYFFVGVRGSF